jgi:hypothetical protein
MTFRKTWRVYQSRLLDHLDGYLQNNRLHLVAAPGSGKTVLGLEVIKRVNRPTLVLAPTITIRDQWVDRLVDLFLPPGSGRPAWVSTELRHHPLRIRLTDGLLERGRNFYLHISYLGLGGEVCSCYLLSLCSP